MAVPGTTTQDVPEAMAVDPVPVKLTITGEEEGEYYNGHNVCSLKINDNSGLGLH